MTMAPRQPLRLARLPERPTSEDLARVYASAVLALTERVNALDEDVTETKAAALVASAAAQRAEDGIAAIAEKVGATVVRRPRLPSMTEYSPDLTPAGGIRVSPEAWDAVQRRIAEQEHRAELEAARAKGAEDERGKLEKASDSLRRRVTFWLAIATAGGGLLTWIATHLLHF